MQSNMTCPRCTHMIPNDRMPGAYPGALSRKDNETEVCSDCGLDEALEQFAGNNLEDEVWPIGEVE